MRGLGRWPIHRSVPALVRAYGLSAGGPSARIHLGGAVSQSQTQRVCTLAENLLEPTVRFSNNSGPGGSRTRAHDDHRAVTSGSARGDWPEASRAAQLA